MILAMGLAACGTGGDPEPRAAAPEGGAKFTGAPAEVKLMTLDDPTVPLPNNKFLTDSVASANAGSVEMMVQMDFYIGLDQNLAGAKNIVTEALTSSRFFSTARPWAVTVSQVLQDNYFALQLRAKAYVLDVRFEKAFETDVTERVVEGFAAATIQPPALLHRST